MIALTVGTLAAAAFQRERRHPWALLPAAVIVTLAAATSTFHLPFKPVERLLNEGLAEGRTASVAIGYRDVMAHLRGELTLAEARDRTVFATRRFARRQDGWFRKDPRVHWIRFDDPGRVEAALALVRGLDDGSAR